MRKDTLKPEVLVTGGAGFIGSHLVDELVRRGRTVRILDNLSSGLRANLEAALESGRAELRVADVRDAGQVSAAAAGCRTIYHLAASVGVGTVARDPLASLENNLEGIGSLLRHTSTLSEPPRLLYFSSSEVYGKSGEGPLREDGAFVIGPASSPRWSYAAAKIAGEYLALGHHLTHRLPVTVVRCFNTSGPRQRSTYGMVIPRFFRQALGGDPLTIYGDGTQTRCFSYVGDVVASVLRLEEEKAAIGEVFNVGSDESVSILGLAERIRDLTASGSRLDFRPLEAVYGTGFEESSHRLPDLAKLESCIGGRPRTTLDEILAGYLEWIRLQPGLWESGSLRPGLPPRGEGARNGELRAVEARGGGAGAQGGGRVSGRSAPADPR